MASAFEEQSLDDQGGQQRRASQTVFLGSICSVRLDATKIDLTGKKIKSLDENIGKVVGEFEEQFSYSFRCNARRFSSAHNRYSYAVPCRSERAEVQQGGAERASGLTLRSSSP